MQRVERAKKSTIVVIGPAGTGKSALCNTLCGDSTKKRYPENSEANSKISQTSKQSVSWFGDNSELVLIDTPGFDDSEDKNRQNITDIVKTLKEIRYVNAFILVLNGQNPRFDERLKSMMPLFQGILTEKYLHNTLLVFTRWPLDQRSFVLRAKSGENEKLKRQNFNQKISELCNFDTKTHPLPCFFFDNCYADPDTNIMSGEELEKFYHEINKLRATVEQMQTFDCENTKTVPKELNENQKNLEAYNMKEIHEIIKGLDRNDYTSVFVKELGTRFPNRNCLIIDDKWDHTIKINNSTYMHFDKPAMWGSYGFDVFLFEDGFVRKGGDGGSLNWNYQGCFDKIDDYTLAFHRNTPNTPS